MDPSYGLWPPSVPPTPPTPGIAPRAVLSVKSNLPDPPTIEFALGGGFLLGIIQNAITSSYVLTFADPVSEADSAVLITIKEQIPTHSALISYLGGNDLRVSGQEVAFDGEGGMTISAISVDFWIAIY